MKSTIEINETNFETEGCNPPSPSSWTLGRMVRPCKMPAPTPDEIATEQAGRVKVARST